MKVCSKADNVINTPFDPIRKYEDFTSSNLLQTPHENETATQHNRLCVWVKTSKRMRYQLCLAAIAVWTHPFPSRTGP